MAKGNQGGRTTELAFVNMGTAERTKLRINMNFLTQIEQAYEAFKNKWSVSGIACPVGSRGEFMQWLMAIGLDEADSQFKLLPAKPAKKKR
jgi:hypothetical protein